VQGAKRSQAGTVALVAGASGAAVRTTFTAAYGCEYAGRSNFEGVAKAGCSRAHGSGIDRRQNRAGDANQGTGRFEECTSSRRSPGETREYAKEWSNLSANS
jgi:hypothetical protein